MEEEKEQPGQNTRNSVLGMFTWELRWDFSSSILFYILTIVAQASNLKFMDHVLLKPDSENFEHYFASM